MVLLSSCASDSVTIKYYKLGSQDKISQSTELTQSVASRPLVLIEPITLADFLRQPGLVIQKTNHQIQISNIHRWSEDLERASSRMILQQLELALPDFRFENQGVQWKARPWLKLSVEFNQFHIVNHQKKVVISGQFWLFDGDRTLLLKKKFEFEQSLNKNGYEHAVSKLELSLMAVSKMIVDGIKEQAH